MDPRLQAGLELQLDKQAQQEYDSSLSGVLGQYFKKEAAEPTLQELAARHTAGGEKWKDNPALEFYQLTQTPGFREWADTVAEERRERLNRGLDMGEIDFDFDDPEHPLYQIPTPPEEPSGDRLQRFDKGEPAAGGSKLRQLLRGIKRGGERASGRVEKWLDDRGHLNRNTPPGERP